MYKYYIYMLGKSNRVSSLFDASISRWTAVGALVFAPILLYAGLYLENIYGFLGFALIFYGAAVIVFVPFAIELFLTSNNID